GCFRDRPGCAGAGVAGLAAPCDGVRGISRSLAEPGLAYRAEIACIGRERADLVVAGCAILESIIDLWPAARVGVADRGIREGILRTLAMQGRDIPVTRREFRK
ncbi:MAG: Ppx/GppA family phosphatase, partial [Sphingopyxis sp.]|nr:Ppx/GppA family phosphatase [Sphingopyxis sp.]